MNDVTADRRLVEKLSLILWRERELLDTLLFKLEEEQLVLASGRTRWLARAAREVETILGSIRETEALRAVAADEVAERIGLSPNPSLQALIDATQDPWRTILSDHREAFATTTAEIERLAESNRDLITNGFRSARETLLSFESTGTGYTQNGKVAATAPASRFVDRSI